MKRLLCLLCFVALFAFFPVFAEDSVLSIENATLVDESRPQISVSFAIDGSTMIVDANEFEYEGDYIEYEFKVVNHSNQSYSLQFDDAQNGEITYHYDYNPTIKAKEEETVKVRVSYTNPSSDEEIIAAGGSKILQQSIGLDAKPVTAGNNVSNNPKTASPLYLFIIIAAVVVLGLLLKSKYAKHVMLLLLVCLMYRLFQPILIYAVENDTISFDIEHHIHTGLKKYSFNYYNQFHGQLSRDRYCVGPIGEKTVQEVYDECVDYTCNVVFRDYKRNGRTVEDKSELMLDTSKGYYECGSSVCLSGDMIVEVYDKKKKKKIKKKLMDVDEDDLLLVWNFDEGCYEYVPAVLIKELEEKEDHILLTFDDGSTLDIVGEHRIFNADKNQFTDASDDKDTPVGTKTIRSDGEVITLVSKEVLHSPVVSCCVITEKHFNVFANDILTSVTLNNMYPIKDMKYVKDERDVFTKEELDIPEYYYEAFRLGELSKNFKGSAEETKKFIDRFVDRAKKQNIIQK